MFEAQLGLGYLKMCKIPHCSLLVCGRAHHLEYEFVLKNKNEQTISKK